MQTELDFYFDFGSPASFLAYKRLLQFEKKYDLKINYKPMLLGAVFKATQNSSPITVPAKGAYMMKHDIPRFAKRYGVAFVMNPHFPINTLQLMRGAHAAIKLGCFPTYCDAVYDAIWGKGLNMGDATIVLETLTKANIDAAAVIELANDPEVKQSLASVTEEAIKRGAFGAPTLYIGDEMFFGQDRLDFVEEYLAEARHR